MRAHCIRRRPQTHTIARLAGSRSHHDAQWSSQGQDTTFAHELAERERWQQPWLAELVAGSIRSGARIDPKEYAEIVKRLLSAKMAELTAERAAHPLCMFAVWKEVDKIQRLIIDGRPVNEYFTNPPFEFTSGEDLSRLQVQLGYLLQVAKCDLSDFFHCC